MAYQDIFAISASGMAVEKLRADVAAFNIANVNTSRAAGDRPFRAARVVLAPTTISDFASLMQGGPVATLVPRVAGVVELDAPPRQVLDPGHPHADDRGYVSYPAVDMLNEMVTIMNATRSYQANVLSLSATRSMAMKALDIGNAR